MKPSAGRAARNPGAGHGRRPTSTSSGPGRWRPTRRTRWRPRSLPAASPLTLLESYDVTFAGADGDPIRRWLHLPAGRPPTPRPGVVEFHRLRRRRRPGAPERPVGRGRGTPTWSWTPRAGLGLVARRHPPTRTARRRPSGFLTRGVLDPAQYYYRGGCSATPCARSRRPGRTRLSTPTASWPLAAARAAASPWPWRRSARTCSRQCPTYRSSAI